MESLILLLWRRQKSFIYRSQFNIENLNLNSDSGKEDGNDVLEDFFIFLKNKNSAKNGQIGRPNPVESLKKIFKNFEDETQESSISNSPMLIKLLKYELWLGHEQLI